MKLSKDLVALAYMRASESPMWLAQDRTYFMELTLAAAVDRYIISAYEKLLFDVQLEFGGTKRLDDMGEVIEYLKANAPEDFPARATGAWEDAYREIAQSVKIAIEESGDADYPLWYLRLERIALKAAEWQLEDAIKSLKR